MIAAIIRELAQTSAVCRLLPIARLESIRSRLAEFAGANELNGFQSWILGELYAFTPPELPFPPLSILIVASPLYARQPITFEAEGKTYACHSTAGLIDPANAPDRLAQRLTEILVPYRYQLRYAPALPHKRLAAHSGLAHYGRNNLCYVPGMGSYLELSSFLTDLPCREDPWRELSPAEHCQHCDACVKACPTEAIRQDRFLIDNERCLTHLQDYQGDFPAWVPTSAHNCVRECLKCQAICPMNLPFRHRAAAPVAFDGAETALLLAGTPYAALPSALQRRLESLGWQDTYDILPRNLRALFAAIDSAR